MKKSPQIDKKDTMTSTHSETDAASPSQEEGNENPTAEATPNNPQEMQETTENSEGYSEDSGTESEPTAEEDPILILEAKLVEYENIIKRQQAEFDNYRKRTLEEKQQLFTYAPGDFIKALLPVINNYTQALTQHANEDDPKTKSFLEGFTILKQQIDEILVSFAVKPSTQVDDLFDPKLHQAIMMEVGEGEQDTVSEVFEQGYLFHERVLKVAHVKVLQKKPLPETPKTETPEKDTDSSPVSEPTE